MEYPHHCATALCAFFALTLSGLNSAANAQTVYGLDVSNHQGDITWSQVAADPTGYKFAWTKATEGTSYLDPWMQDNLHDAAQVKLPAGVYDFAHPETNTPVAEADYFVNFATAQAAGTSNEQSVSENAFAPGRLVPALDMETGGGAHVGASSLSAWCNAWCAEVFRLTGVHPVIYTYPSFASSYLTSSVTSNPLWIASYDGLNPTTDPSKPTGPWNGSWSFWQYTSSGTVSGISGGVDLDQYNGSLASFQSNFVIQPFTLTWNQVAGKWNTDGTNTPWLNGANALDFANTDTANFTNAAVGSVAIDAGGVSPTATNVSNSTGTYTFTGGGILKGPLTKTNSGTLILSNSKNAFTSVTVSGGTLDIESNGSGSTLPANISITNNASLIINDSAATTASQIAGTGSTTIGTSGNVTVGTLNQSGVVNNGTLTVKTAGTITGAITGTGGTTINAGGVISAGKVVQNSLTVNGALKITAGNGPQAPDHTSVLNTLAVSGGLLDVTDDAVVVHAGSPSAAATAAAAINTQIALGAHNTGSGPTYLGATGITSSTISGGSLSAATYGVGVASQTAAVTSFGGQTVGSGDVLMGLTLLGDTDMSGTVDFNDLNNLLTNYGSTGTTWQQGNFNYAPDGTDFGDLNSLLTNYQQSLVYGTSAINAISDHLDAPAIQMLEARGFSVVPEPCTLSLLGLGALGLMRRRRRLATR